MSKEEKILSYWSVRRRVRASVSSQLTDIETAISSTEQEEYDISESENLSFHQPPSTSNHDNVNFENPDMPSSVCEDQELQEDIDMAGNNDHDDHIRKTCPCDIYPLEPHFYIAKMGYAGVYLFFLFLLQNIDCGYSLEPPRRGGSNVYPQSVF